MTTEGETKGNKRIHTAIAEGTKFGHLTVTHRVENENGYAMYQCLCDCGNYTVVKAVNLKRGRVQKCKYHTPTKQIEVGKKYGWLTVTEYALKGPRDRKHYWFCDCRCGNETMVREDNLVNGRSTSCGCKRTYYSKKERAERKEEADELREFQQMEKEWKMRGMDRK